MDSIINDLENNVVHRKNSFSEIKLVSYEEIMLYYKKKLDKFDKDNQQRFLDLYKQIKELKDENDKLKNREDMILVWESKKSDEVFERKVV